MVRWRARAAWLALILASAGASAQHLSGADAAAQAYPAKSIRILVGFTPGGAPDVTARVIAQKLTESWKQQVIVENRPGAGGTVAAQILANTAPDGYTLLSVTNSHAVSASIYSKLAYDPIRDFAGITLTSTAPALLLVPHSLGVKSARELIAMAKAKPGELNFSSAGVGSAMHFQGELFNNMAGIRTVHVPMKGPPEALTETMTGRVQFVISPIGVAMSLVKEGKLAAIGVAAGERLPQLPDVPTITESGLPGYKTSNWSGFIAPVKTPRPVINKLNEELRRILSTPEVKTSWAAIGAMPAPISPTEFDRFIADEIETFMKIARSANIKAE